MNERTPSQWRCHHLNLDWCVRELRSVAPAWGVRHYRVSHDGETVVVVSPALSEFFPEVICKLDLLAVLCTPSVALPGLMDLYMRACGDAADAVAREGR